MRNAVCLVLVLLSLSSCKQLIDACYDISYSSEYSNIPLYYGDFDIIPEKRYIPMWMSHYIKYQETIQTKTPQEVIESGSGDCDGFALVYMNIAYVRFGIKANLCLVNSRSVVSGGSVNHAVVEINGICYNAQSGSQYTGEIGYRYTFDQVFKY